MRWNMKYEDALAKADNLIALDDTVVYLDHADLPWDKATDVELGSAYRLNGPISVYVIAVEAGLTFKWSLDFEKRDANGTSVSDFDRERLREAIMKMPPPVREKFGALLRDHVLPGLEKTAREWRAYLNRQLDSEDCVRGLIAYAFKEA